MDHIKSKDLYRWLKYVGWTEKEFDMVADTFRDPRVWWIKDNQWWKDNVWGKPSSYGKVNLPKELKKTIHDKIKGRIVIFNAEKSEFAKNLKIDKSGDYIEKK